MSSYFAIKGPSSSYLSTSLILSSGPVSLSRAVSPLQLYSRGSAELLQSSSEPVLLLNYEIFFWREKREKIDRRIKSFEVKK